MRILLLDTFSFDNHHEKFNASLLMTIVKMGYETVYVGSLSSSQNVLSYLDFEDIKKIAQKRVFVFRGEYGLKLYLRFFISALMNILLLMKSRKDDILFFNSNPYILFPLFNFINKILDRKVIICCHGELEAFANRHRRSLLGAYIRHLFQNRRMAIAESLRFAVLGDSIMNNLNKILPPNIFSHFVSFDHPYLFDDEKSSTNSIDKICYLGTVSNVDDTRGDKLLQIAKETCSYEGIKIKSIGRILSQKMADKLLKSGVYVSGYLPREEYDNQIQSLNCILYLYAYNAYEFTASGALFDAINHSKPVIAIENQYFKYVSEKYGSIGCLAKDEFEIIEIVKRLSKKNFEFQVDFESLRRDFSPITISKQVKQIILEI